MVGARHHGCANLTNRGTCGNRLTIRRDLLEETVLSGLKNNLLLPDLIREFVEEHQREFNRQRREQTNGKAAARTELAKVERQIRGIIEAVKDGMCMPSMREEMLALEARKAVLVEQTRDQAKEPVLLHPGLADVYRRKVENLTEALNQDDLRAEAAEALRSMIQTIRLFRKTANWRLNSSANSRVFWLWANKKTPSLFGWGFDN